MQEQPQKQPYFSQLTLAGTLGGLSALTIAGIILAFLFSGNATGPYQERGSGRSEIKIVVTEEKKEPPKRENTEIATAEQAEQKPSTSPPNPGKPRD